MTTLPDWAAVLQARRLASYSIYGGPGTIPGPQATPGYALSLWDEYVPASAVHRKEGIIAFMLSVLTIPDDLVAAYVYKRDISGGSQAGVRVLPDPDGLTGDLFAWQFVGDLPLFAICTSGLSLHFTSTDTVDRDVDAVVHCMKFSLAQEAGVREVLASMGVIR